MKRLLKDHLKFQIQKLRNLSCTKILMRSIPRILTQKLINCENFKNQRLFRRRPNCSIGFKLRIKSKQLRKPHRNPPRNTQCHPSTEHTWPGWPSRSTFPMTSLSLQTPTGRTFPAMSSRFWSRTGTWRAEKAWNHSLMSRLSGINNDLPIITIAKNDNT